MLYLITPAVLAFIFWFGREIHRTPIDNTGDELPTAIEEFVD